MPTCSRWQPQACLVSAVESPIEYLFAGMLGPWLSLLRVAPHRVKSCVHGMVMWFLTLAAIPVVVILTLPAQYREAWGPDVTLAELCSAIIMTIGELAWEKFTIPAAAVASWLSACFEFVVLVFIGVWELPLAQHVWQQLLLPRVRLVTAGVSWLLKSGWGLLRGLALWAAGTAWQFACKLLPSATSSRISWEHEVAEALGNGSRTQKGSKQVKQQVKGRGAAPSKQRKHKPDRKSRAKPAMPATDMEDESLGDSTSTETSRGLFAVLASPAASPKAKPQPSKLPQPWEAAAAPADKPVTSDARSPASGAFTSDTQEMLTQGEPFYVPPYLLGGSNQAQTLTKGRPKQHQPLQTRPSAAPGKALKPLGRGHDARTDSVSNPGASVAPAKPIPPQPESSTAEEAKVTADVARRATVGQTSDQPGESGLPSVTHPPPQLGEAPQPRQASPQLQSTSPQLRQESPQLQHSPPQPLNLPAAPDQSSRSGRSSPAPSTPEAASDPLAFLLGQPAFSPSRGHASLPTTKPAVAPDFKSPPGAAARAEAERQTSKAPKANQELPKGKLEDSQGLQKASLEAPRGFFGAGKGRAARVYCPPAMHDASAASVTQHAGEYAEADMGDDCIVCWVAKRATALAPCGHKALCR